MGIEVACGLASRQQRQNPLSNPPGCEPAVALVPVGVARRICIWQPRRTRAANRDRARRARQRTPATAAAATPHQCGRVRAPASADRVGQHHGINPEIRPGSIPRPAASSGHFRQLFARSRPDTPAPAAISFPSPAQPGGAHRQPPPPPHGRSAATAAGPCSALSHPSGAAGCRSVRAAAANRTRSPSRYRAPSAGQGGAASPAFR